MDKRFLCVRLKEGKSFNDSGGETFEGTARGNGSTVVDGVAVMDQIVRGEGGEEIVEVFLQTGFAIFNLAANLMLRLFCRASENVVIEAWGWQSIGGESLRLLFSSFSSLFHPAFLLSELHDDQ